MSVVDELKLKRSLSKEELRSMLPKVGDRLMHRQLMGYPHREFSEPRSCVVIFVNEKHLWYEVQFDNGFRECYRLPETVAPENDPEEWGEDQCEW